MMIRNNPKGKLNKMMKSIFFAITLIILVKINGHDGHGMVVNPINRASRWRCFSSAPIDYNDNQLYCGGLNVQFGTYKGKCGICGDSYGDPKPRSHELGGKYGQGVVVKKYAVGSMIDVDVLITANHKGYFRFDLCRYEGVENDACFRKNKLKTSEGSWKWTVPSNEPKLYTVNLKLPEGLVCKLCILRWTYVAGNNWGICPNGTGAVGCGPQEHFRTCSDISITTKKAVLTVPNWNDICTKQKNFVEDILEEFKDQKTEIDVLPYPLQNFAEEEEEEIDFNNLI